MTDEMPFEWFKFQLDITGTGVLAYNEDETHVIETHDPNFVLMIRDALDMHTPLTKCYARARLLPTGELQIDNSEVKLDGDF